MVTEVVDNIGAQPWKVDLPHLLGILETNLYASDEVAIRELISNASDSISQREKEEGRANPAHRIHVWIDDGTLVIEDTGVGMQQEQLHDVFSTVASSSKAPLAPDFSNFIPQQLQIGQLGIGRLAAYLIADEMTVETKSIAPESDAYRWVGTTQSYRVEPCEKSEPGTKTILSIKGHLRSRFLNKENLERIIFKHSRNLGYNIFVADDPTPVNGARPPWYTFDMKAAGEDGSSLYRRLCEVFLDETLRRESRFADAEKDERVSTIPLYVDEVGTKVRIRGVLYVPPDEHFALKHGGGVDIYSRGVFVCSDHGTLIPGEINFVKGIVECPDFSPKADRQGVVEDTVFETVRFAIQRAVQDHLAALGTSTKKEDRIELANILNCHRRVIMQGARYSNESFFDAVTAHIQFQSNKGQPPFTTLGRYWTQAKEPVISFVRRKVGQVHLEKMIEDHLGEVLVVGTEDEEAVLDRFAQSKGGRLNLVENLGDIVKDQFTVIEPPDDGWVRMIEYFTTGLQHPELLVTAEVARFANSTMPAIVIPDASHEKFRRMLTQIKDQAEAYGTDVEGDQQWLTFQRQILNQFQQKRKVTLYLNADHSGMKMLAAMVLNAQFDSECGDILHEIFHTALVFADMPPAIDHLCEYHDKIINKLCKSLELVQTKDAGLIDKEKTLQQQADAIERLEDQLAAAEEASREGRSASEKTLQLQRRIDELSEQANSLEKKNEAIESQFESATESLRLREAESSSLQARIARFDTKTPWIQCFLAYPFRDQYDPLLVALRSVLEDAPYFWQVITAADFSVERTITEQVVNSIRSADCYLAEVSELNPNVMMEVGMMEMLHEERPLGLLRNDAAAELPADIKSHIYIPYSGCHEGVITNSSALTDELAGKLKKALRLTQLRGEKRFLSRTLLSKTEDLADTAITRILDHYDTVEAICEENVASIASKTEVRKEFVKIARDDLKKRLIC